MLIDECNLSNHPIGVFWSIRHSFHIYREESGCESGEVEMEMEEVDAVSCEFRVAVESEVDAVEGRRELDCGATVIASLCVRFDCCPTLVCKQSTRSNQKTETISL